MYTMPPRAANRAGTAFVYEDRVRMVAGGHEAEHARGKPGDARASLPVHRAEKLAAVHGARAKLYEMRQQLLGLGPDALTLLTAPLHRAPTRGTEHTERLYALYQQHGERGVSLLTDVNHCGRCGNACAGGALCLAGACACPLGTASCGGARGVTSTNAQACGACGRACRNDQVCAAGACACPAGLSDCGGFCVDAAHCGACNRACPAGQSCTGGTCS